MADDADVEKLATQLKEQHGVDAVHVFTAATGDAIFVRMPPAGVWRRFRTQMHDERKRVEAGEVLLRACLLHPSQEAFTQMAEARPGLVELFSGELVELAGLQKQSLEKKVF